MIRSMTTALLTSVAVLLGVAPAPPVRAGQPATAVEYDGPIGRTVVMQRALDWLRRDIAYSQDNRQAKWDANRGRRYRPDCSGLISMAWAVNPGRPGPGRALVTWELPSISTRVGWARLRRGDILLYLEPGNRAREHVQLFAGWVDPGRTRAWIIEASGRTHGMRRRTVAVATASELYAPYRYRRIHDRVGPRSPG
jgi:hypothetical protein